MERLCASTQKGSLHFYALNDTDNDSNEDHEDDDLLSLNPEFSASGAQAVDCIETASETTRCFQDPPEIVPVSELKRLETLCAFEAFKSGFSAVVPPCWSEMQQAQRQRRLPQHMINDLEQHTKTWRLQTDTTTWDEHIFEIMLPSASFVGHLDVHFALHASTALPRVEVTLLKQNNNGIGHRRDVKFSVDDGITLDALANIENPVISQEYLRAHNADILAGPVDISTGLDLSEQSGCLTLTSPKLFKYKNRSLLLHIKAVKDDVTSAPSSSKSKSNERKVEYMGCDCLHELSVTIYSSKHTDIQHERSLRCSMLESNSLLHSLVLTALENNSESQGIALDLLNWIGAIRLNRNRSQNGEAPSHQEEFLQIIQGNVNDLIRECILVAGRSIAHKCVKLVVLCSK